MLAQQLGELILLNAEAISATGLIADVIAKLHQKSGLTDYGTHMIQRLLENKIPIKDVVWTHILPTAASMTANQSQIFCQSFDYYLTEGAQYIPDLYRLAKDHSKEADELLLRYFLEGARLRATVGLFRDYKPTAAGAPTTASIPTSNGSTLSVPQGRRILVDIISASRDPTAFPEPGKVKLDRPMDSYLQYGWGPHQCAGMDVSLTAMTAMFKVVFGLKGLKRAQGSGPGGMWYGESQGELKKVMGPDGLTMYMTPDWGTYFPFPTTMKVQWDADL